MSREVSLKRDRAFRANLARLLPEWGQPSAGAPATSAAEPVEARARLLEALAQALAIGCGGSHRSSAMAGR